MKSKWLKYKITKNKDKQSKIKLINFGKELGTSYFLGCKDFTHNFKLREVNMTNKVLREKSSKSNWVSQDFENKSTTIKIDLTLYSSLL